MSEQTRFECTPDDIHAWEKAWLECVADRDEIPSAPPRIIVAEKLPPCLGCGTPVRPYAGDRAIDPVVTVDTGIGRVVFAGCGCELAIVELEGRRS